MKHYGLDLKVAFKHRIMQQSVEFVCARCFATYLTAKTLFVLIPSHFHSYFFSRFRLASAIPLPSPQVLIEAVILFMTNLFNGGDSFVHMKVRRDAGKRVVALAKEGG